MKLTKTQTANLTAIWTTKTAAGAIDADGRQVRMSKGQCAAAGFVNMNANASSSLVTKGLATALTTLVAVGAYRVQVLILTDAGRAALGV